MRRSLKPTIETSRLRQDTEEEVVVGGRNIRLRHILRHTAKAGVTTKDKEVGYKEEDGQRQEYTFMTGGINNDDRN